MVPSIAMYQNNVIKPIMSKLRIDKAKGWFGFMAYQPM